MTTLDIVTYEEEIGQLEGSVRRLCQDANAKAVLLFDRDGRPVVKAGDTGSVDTTPPAVLTGGSGDGGAELIDRREQSVLIHEGQGDNVHLAIVVQWAVLVVLFDDPPFLSLVRQQVKSAQAELEKTVEAMRSRTRRKTRPCSTGSATTTSGRSSAQAPPHWGVSSLAPRHDRRRSAARLARARGAWCACEPAAGAPGPWRRFSL
ncbi:hypothetical protein ACFYN3_40815 [Streptomyces lavendulae]|uniref:hypothetical protein n=1 Tax=Streptomyces lavendulae TaxID=1914 RepID=UPI0033DE1EFD